MNKGCGIAGGVILFILSLGLGYYFYTESVKAPEVYESEKPVIGDIIKKTVATGAVKPRKEIMVKPQVSGVVEALYVEAGEIVKKGQKLAKIKLVPSQLNINNAQSGAELAKIRYDESKRELERQKGVFDRKLDISDATASYQNAQKEEGRQRQLLADGVISQQDYDRQKLDLDLRKETGCTVIGFIKPDKEYIINPEADCILIKGSHLIVLGRPEQIIKLRELF